MQINFTEKMRLQRLQCKQTPYIQVWPDNFYHDREYFPSITNKNIFNFTFSFCRCPPSKDSWRCFGISFQEGSQLYLCSFHVSWWSFQDDVENVLLTWKNIIDYFLSSKYLKHLLLISWTVCQMSFDRSKWRKNYSSDYSVNIGFLSPAWGNPKQ